jgi:V/A-type H+/Na+-transporting ATPase subunit A
MLDKVLEVYNTGFEFESFDEVNPYFKRVINEFKQMNYSDFESEQFKNHEKELSNIIDEKKIA